MMKSPKEVQIAQEFDELQFQKALIRENASKARVALETLQEFTGFDFSSALRGIATIEELNAKTTHPIKLVHMYLDLEQEAF